MHAGGVDIYFIHPDHLDTPRALVNANDQPIWLWDSAPFGDTAANEQPIAGLPNFTFNLRFPGQKYDRETGTHYNYFRDYEPGTGRYVQSDPIGLWGGINSFAYVWNGPLSSSDFLGLRPKPPAVPDLTPRNKVPDDKVLPPNKRGNAPVSCDDGCPIELHHVDQESDIVD